MGKSVDVQRLVDNGTFRFVWIWVDDKGKYKYQIPLSGTELLRIKSDVVRVRAYAPNVMMVFTRQIIGRWQVSRVYARIVYPASLKGRFIMYRWTYSDSAEMYHSAYQNVRQGERRITTLAECKRSILAAAAKSDSVRYARITEYSDENPMGDTVASYNVKRKSDGTYHLSVCKKVDMGKANYLRSISGIRGAFQQGNRQMVGQQGMPSVYPAERLAGRQMVAGYNYDRLDIIQAHYWYCTHYHNGMMSREYARLCKMQRYYTPGRFENMPTTYAAAYIYNQLESNAGYSMTEWKVDDNGEIAWGDSIHYIG